MINYADLSASLEIMWKGMLGLFVVCGCIMLLIMAIKRIVKKESRLK
jgi:4-amino-4-deoxy-L-arabinose transferase-like glycosyltransferase